MLKVKIVCNGVKPLKSAVYLLAAELCEVEELNYFSDAVIQSLKSHDYYDYYDYYYDDYDTDYYAALNQDEKVIALLFLSALYEAKGE